MENFSITEVILRIGPLSKLGCFESTAEIFCLHCFNQLSEWADPRYYSWCVKVLHKRSFCKNACWCHQRFKRKPRDGISCACSKKLCRLVHENCLMYSIFRRGIFLEFFSLIEEKKNFLIKLFSERDVKIRVRDKPKMFAMWSSLFISPSVLFWNFFGLYLACSGKIQVHMILFFSLHSLFLSFILQ